MNYESITNKLKESSAAIVRITFEDFIDLAGKLPEEAQNRIWWDNSGETSQSKAWCNAGFQVTKVVPGFYIQFSKILGSKKEETPSPFLKEVKKEMDAKLVPGEKSDIDKSSVLETGFGKKNEHKTDNTYKVNKFENDKDCSGHPPKFDQI